MRNAKKVASYVVASLLVLFVSMTLSGCGQAHGSSGFAPVETTDSQPTSGFDPFAGLPAPKPQAPYTGNNFTPNSGTNSGNTPTYVPWTPALKVEMIDLRYPWSNQVMRSVGDNNNPIMLSLRITAKKDNVALTAMGLLMTARPQDLWVEQGIEVVGKTKPYGLMSSYEIAPVGTAIATLEKTGDTVSLNVRANMTGLDGATVVTMLQSIGYTVAGKSDSDFPGVYDSVRIVESPRASIAAVITSVRTYPDKLSEVVAAEVEVFNTSKWHWMEVNSLSFSVDTANHVGLRLEDENQVLLSTATQTWGMYPGGRADRWFSLRNGTCRLAPNSRIRLKVLLDARALVNDSVDLQITSVGVTNDEDQYTTITGIYDPSNGIPVSLVTNFSSNVGGPSEAFTVTPLMLQSTIATLGSNIVAKYEVASPAHNAGIHTITSFTLLMNSNATKPRNFRVLVNGQEQAAFSMNANDFSTVQPTQVTLQGVTLAPGQTVTIEIEMEVPNQAVMNVVQMQAMEFTSDAFIDPATYFGWTILLG